MNSTPRADMKMDDDSDLSDVVVAWEAEAQPAIDAGIRTAFLRTGIVLGHDGLLGTLLPSFKVGAGSIVGSGAQILGPFTVGAGARVGANAVVVDAVPPGVTVVGIPAKIVKRSEPQREPEDFAAYGVAGDFADPLSRSMAAMQAEIERLAAKVEALEADVDEPAHKGTDVTSARSA